MDRARDRDLAWIVPMVPVVHEFARDLCTSFRCRDEAPGLAQDALVRLIELDGRERLQGRSVGERGAAWVRGVVRVVFKERGRQRGRYTHFRDGLGKDVSADDADGAPSTRTRPVFDPDDYSDILTKRELEALGLITGGTSVRAGAARIGVSRKAFKERVGRAAGKIRLLHQLGADAPLWLARLVVRDSRRLWWIDAWRQRHLGLSPRRIGVKLHRSEGSVERALRQLLKYEER